MRPSFWRTLLSLTCLLLLSVATGAGGELHLRNGQVLTGEIIVAGDTVRIELEDGNVLLFPRGEVEKIEQDAAMPDDEPEDEEAGSQEAEVSKAVEELVTAAAAERRKAEEKLAAYGDFAVEPLAEQLGLPIAPSVGQSIMRVLRSIGTPAAGKAMRSAALSTNAKIRQAAAAGLGSFSDADSAAVLMRLIDFDNSADVQAAGVRSAGEHGDWRFVPSICGVLANSPKLRRDAAEALARIGDPSSSLFLYEALKSNSGGTAASAWEALFEVAVPAQAGYVADFMTGADKRYDQRVMKVLKELEGQSLASLVSLLNARNDILRARASMELLGKSGGERFGLDQDAWYTWASEKLKTKLLLVKLPGTPAEAMQQVVAMIEKLPQVEIIDDRYASELRPIPGTDPPELRADDLLDLLEKRARDRETDLVLGITPSKIRVVGKPISFSAVRSGRSAVVSYFHLTDESSERTLRRVAAQSLHTTALLLRMPPCPEEDESCAAIPVHSARAVDALSGGWCESCRENLTLCLGIFRQEMVGNLPAVANGLAKLGEEYDEPERYLEAARRCEIGISPQNAISYWQKYLEEGARDDTSLTTIIQSRIEMLSNIRDAIELERKALGL